MYKKIISEYKDAGDDFYNKLLLKNRHKTGQVSKQLVADYEDVMSEFILEEKNPFILYQAGLENKDHGLLALAQDGFIECLKIVGFKKIETICQMIDNVIVCAKILGEDKKAEAFKDIREIRTKIEEGEILFEERYPRLNPEYSIYDQIAQGVKFSKKNITGSLIDDSLAMMGFYEKYAYALDRAGLEAEAITQYQWLIDQFPDDFASYINFANFYAKRSKNQDDNFLLALELIRQVRDKYDRLDFGSDKRILADIRKAYWHLLRRNNLLTECKETIEEALKRNDVSFIKKNFLIKFDWTKEDEKNIEEQYNFAKRFAKIIPEIDKLFLSSGVKLEEYLPTMVHLHNIANIKVHDEIIKDDPLILGAITVEEGNYKDVTKKRKIDIFGGLTEEEKYFVLLHEIGHNSYFLLSDAHQCSWQKLAKYYNLNQDYTQQDEPEEEAYADCYANFILFNDLWQKLAKEKGPFLVKNRILFNFFRVFVFRLNKENNNIFKQKKLKEDFKYFNENIKSSLFFKVS